MRNDDQIRIPASILNNPIHEVRPLVVNLYYKKPNPGVGSYDVSVPGEISKVIEDPNRLNFKSVFESKRQRFSPRDFIVGDKDILFDKKRKNDYYDVYKA